MRIGVLTMHNFYNYGAMLQAFATQVVIEDMGHDIKFIDYYPEAQERINTNRLTLNPKKLITNLILSSNKKYKLRRNRFHEFGTRFNTTERFFTKDEIYRNPPEFDVYIVGSDQVWNMENGFNSFAFLDFANSYSKKISYASSFGTESISDQFKIKLKESLKSFNAISTREDDGVQIIKDAAGRDAVQVLDPTLLLTNDIWKTYLPKLNKNQKEYILIYALNDTKQSEDLLLAIRKRYDLPVHGIPMGNKLPHRFKVDKEINDAGPMEFVSSFLNAKVICTSSFHGLAFAVNFEKTFFVLPHPNRNSRLNSLMKLLKLEKRQKFSPEEILKLNDSDLYMDYSKTSIILNKQRTNSLDFLKDNI